MRRTHIVIIAALVVGCRAQGLPELPADQDAANPSAPAVPHEASIDDTDARGQLTKSAFDGVKLGKGGHEHMNHGAPKKAESKPKAVDHATHGDTP